MVVLNHLIFIIKKKKIVERNISLTMHSYYYFGHLSCPLLKRRIPTISTLPNPTPITPLYKVDHVNDVMHALFSIHYIVNSFIYNIYYNIQNKILHQKKYIHTLSFSIIMSWDSWKMYFYTKLFSKCMLSVVASYMLVVFLIELLRERCYIGMLWLQLIKNKSFLWRY